MCCAYVFVVRHAGFAHGPAIDSAAQAAASQHIDFLFGSGASGSASAADFVKPSAFLDISMNPFFRNNIVF